MTSLADDLGGIVELASGPAYGSKASVIGGVLKPLEWKQGDGGVWADTLVAKYTIEFGETNDGRMWYVKKIGPWIQSVPSIERGKQLCEEHYRLAIEKLFE